MVSFQTSAGSLSTLSSDKSTTQSSRPPQLSQHNLNGIINTVQVLGMLSRGWEGVLSTDRVLGWRDLSSAVDWAGPHPHSFGETIHTGRPRKIHVTPLNRHDLVVSSPRSLDHSQTVYPLACSSVDGQFDDLSVRGGLGWAGPRAGSAGVGQPRV